MAHLLEDRGDVNEAIAVFEDLVRIRPDHRGILSAWPSH